MQMNSFGFLVMQIDLGIIFGDARK